MPSPFPAIEHLLSDSFWQDDASHFLSSHSSSFAGHRPAASGQLFFQTSGSTGNPKWIALSRHALIVSAAAVNRHLEVRPDSRWGLALPVHHVGGFGVIARAREAGCALRCFPGKWNPASFARWLADERITHTSLVPTQVHDLVSGGETAPVSLRVIVVGGGELPDHQGRAARALGWPVLASYGMTEACSQIATQSLSALDGPFTNRPLPLLPHWQAEEVPDGRLAISGESLFSGTWTEETGYQPRRGNSWLTPDLVRVTPGGLIPLGRADELVKILGELVNPSSVERELLADHPDLTGNLIVVSLPDERRGRRLVPVADGEKTSPPAISAAISAYNARVSGHLRLDPPVFPVPFPRSPLGKPLRPAMASLFSP